MCVSVYVCDMHACGAYVYVLVCIYYRVYVLHSHCVYVFVLMCVCDMHTCSACVHVLMCMCVRVYVLYMHCV